MNSAFPQRVNEVAVIEEPGAAAAALDPVKASLLAALAEPRSAAGLSAQVGLTRQKVNYHLRALEAHGLVREVGTRRWGGLNERLLSATAASYVISPAALGPAAADPVHTGDRRSARYLLALAARLVRELGGLTRRADREQLATLSIATELRFASAAERTAFAEELAGAVGTLVSRYHVESGQPYRLVVGAHPVPGVAADGT